MRKELIAFLLVAGLGALMWVASGDDEAARGRQRQRRSAEAPTVVPPTQQWLPEEAFVWSQAGDNIYRAPRDTEPLEPITIAPPPLPRLPHPGLPLVPRLGGAARESQRHDHPLDPKVPLQAQTSSVVAAPASGDEVAEAGLDPLDQVQSAPLSAADRIRLSTEEKLRMEALTREKSRAEEDRRREMDVLIYDRGQKLYGRAEGLNPEDDIHAIKLAIDRLRADRGLAEEQRRRALDQISFVFREDRGPGKAPSRVTVKAGAVMAIEFAKSPRNDFRLAMLQTQGDDFAARLGLIRTLANAGETELALAELKKLHDAHPGSPASYALWSDAARRMLDFERELSTIDAGLAKWPEDLDLLARKGQFCLRIGLAAKAEEAFQAVLVTRPQDALSRFGMGRVALLRGDLQSANGHLQAARDAGGLDAGQLREVLLLLGEVALRQGDLARAERAYDRVLDGDSTDAAGLAGRAVIAMAKTGPSAALPILAAAREAHPLDGRLAWLHAVALLRDGRYAEAWPLIDLVPELDPFLTPEARLARSWLAEKAGRAELALAAAEEALVADPTHEDALRQRARAAFLVGDTTAAETGFLRVLARDPEDIDALLALGDNASVKGDLAAAVRWYARVHELKPDLPGLFVRRFVAAIRAGDPKAAQELKAGINARMERDPELQAALAYYFYAIESNPQEALQRHRQILAKENEGTQSLRTYVQSTQDAITDNLSKERWREDFERTGQQIGRDWERRVGQGVQVVLSSGRLLFSGSQTGSSMEPTVAWQQRAGRSFHTFEADLDMQARAGVFQGIGLLAFQRATAPEPYEGLQRRDDGAPNAAIAYYGGQIALAPEGRLRYRYLDKGVMSEWEDLPVTYEGGPVRLGFEIADRAQHEVFVLVNRRRAGKVKMPGIGRWQRLLELQIFCQADNGREVSGFAADNVEIITSKQ